MKKTAIIVCVFISALFGCRVKYLPVTSTESSRTEACTSVRETDEHLITVTDTATMAALVACDSLGNVYLKTIEQLQGTMVTQQLALEADTVRVVSTALGSTRTVIRYRDSIIKVELVKEIPKIIEIERELTATERFSIKWAKWLLLAVFMATVFILTDKRTFITAFFRSITKIFK